MYIRVYLKSLWIIIMIPDNKISPYSNFKYKIDNFAYTILKEKKKNKLHISLHNFIHQNNRDLKCLSKYYIVSTYLEKCFIFILSSLFVFLISTKSFWYSRFMIKCDHHDDVYDLGTKSCSINRSRSITRLSQWTSAL